MRIWQRILAPLAMTLAVASSSMPANARRTSRAAHHIEPAPPVPAPCLQFYVGEEAPAPVVPTAPAGRIFCHSFYALSYSTTLRDPLWTSYELTADMVAGSSGFGRSTRHTFVSQASLSPADQARDQDYAVYERGHMTPDNDAGTQPTQADTYVVTNIVPQNGRLNRGLWKSLERAVHRLATSEGRVFVVTGPLFEESIPAMHGVAVPSSVFKAIYVPRRNFALAFVATNRSPTNCTIVPVAEIARRAGIDPFPSLPESAKRQLPIVPHRWGGFPQGCHR